MSKSLPLHHSGFLALRQQQQQQQQQQLHPPHQLFLPRQSRSATTSPRSFDLSAEVIRGKDDKKNKFLHKKRFFLIKIFF